MFMRLAVVTLSTFLGLGMVCAQAPGAQGPSQDQPVPTVEKPRIFITDSQSWEIAGHAGGANGAFGAETHGGARPQTAEIIKTFGERCPGVMINNQQSKANYIVVLDHEAGKGYLRHRNKVAVFDSSSGDAVISKSTLSLGGSVEDACKGILQHWASHKPPVQADSPAQPKPAVVDPVPEKKQSGAKLNVASLPEGADIEVDGNFMGSTPSSLELATGNHTVLIKKAGYKTWERKLTVSGGDVSVKAELEKQN